MPHKIFAFADEASAAWDGQIRAMLRNGLDGLEIRNVDGENVSDLTTQKAEALRRRMDNEGLRIWTIGSPIGKAALEDSGIQLEKLKRTLELAHVLGAENIRLFSFYIPPQADPSAYRDTVLEQLTRMTELARGSGVILCHENEKGIYGDTAERCLEILKAVPELKGIFDPANFVQCEQDCQAAWDTLRPYIKYLHIKDARRDGVVVPAGKGTGCLLPIVRDYLQNGGNAFTIEPHLMDFVGFSALEEGLEGHFEYAFDSQDDAFDAACSAFKQVLADAVR